MSPITLLLIEDDPDVREALTLTLEDEGYRVAGACHGEAALRYLRQERAPQLILLDLMMPVMDGYQFRAAQVADPALVQIPVFVLTAGTIDQRVEALKVASIFRKPVDLDVFLRAIGVVTGHTGPALEFR